MVEIYMPFVLLLLSWNPAAAQETMSITQRVLLDHESCIAAGEEVAAQVREQDRGESQFVWSCQPHVREIEVYRALPGDR